MMFSRKHFILRAEVNVFCFWWKIHLFSNYLKTNNICITVDNFFHDSLFSILPVECPRWAVAIELPGGVFITQHIVTHNCEWSWKERKKGKGYQPLKITKMLNLFKPKYWILHGLFWSACWTQVSGLILMSILWASSYQTRLNSPWKENQHYYQKERVLCA